LILYINENWQNTVLLVTKSVGKCKDEIDQLRTYLNESKIQNRAADRQDTLNKTLQKVVENHKTLLSHQQTQIEKTREDQSSLRRATVTDYKTLQKVVVQTITLLSSQQTQIDNQRQEIKTLKQMFNTMSLSQSNQDQKVVDEQKTLLSSQQTQIDNQRQEIETLKQMFNIF
jgi:hypothetical protein